MKRTLFGLLAWIVILLFSHVCAAQSFLENEAGISAFCKLNTVNLSQAATAYKNIEYQTTEYIIGSVAIPNYPERDDVHVYLNVSGDMIAYYLREENAAKIIDWKTYYSTKVLSGSKLETALKIVTNAMGQNPTNIKYSDFRFPQANSIKIVLEEAKNETETFRMLIPSSYAVYNRSFSHALYGLDGFYAGSGTLKVDSDTLSTGSVKNPNWYIQEGNITPSQLSPDSYHIFSIQANNYCWEHVAIVLLYTEP